MRTLVVSHAGRFQEDLPPQAVAEALHDPHDVLWLDITDPSEEDVALLRDGSLWGFHPLAVEDALRPHERPKVDAYGVPGDHDGDGVPDNLDSAAGLTGATGGAYYFVVFYAAAYHPEQEHIETHAASLFIGQNYLVTVHQGPAPHIADTISRWRVPGSPLPNRIGALVHALLDAMVDDYFPLMDQVADRVEDLEDTIFIHFDEGSIETIFRLKKDLLNMRRIIAPERDVLNVLLRRQLPIFTAEDVAYLQDVYDHIVRVTDNIDTYRDLLSSALDSYLSLQSNKLNQIMKVLTIGSIILMADALVTGYYGQNFKFFPELGWATGSFWALILMAVITAGLVVYFKRKKWW